MRYQINNFKFMEKDNLTPEQSFELITKVINEARNRFEENGLIYVFWGALIALASFGQYYLLKTEHTDIHWYPYLLMPLGSIFTGIYYAKKKKTKRKNMIEKILAVLWNVLALYMLILGFLFAGHLRENLLPIILILLSIGIIVSGVSIRKNILLFSGFIIGISAIYAFYLNLIYQPLLAGIISVVAILIPGIILMYQHKNL